MSQIPKNATWTGIEFSQSDHLDKGIFQQDDSF